MQYNVECKQNNGQIVYGNATVKSMVVVKSFSVTNYISLMCDFVQCIFLQFLHCLYSLAKVLT